MCVCEGREKLRRRGRGKVKARGRACVCVCMCVRVCSEAGVAGQALHYCTVAHISASISEAALPTHPLDALGEGKSLSGLQDLAANSQPSVPAGQGVHMSVWGKGAVALQESVAAEGANGASKCPRSGGLEEKSGRGTRGGGQEVSGVSRLSVSGVSRQCEGEDRKCQV